MLIERLLKIALLGSEWVLYLLAALSMLSLTITAERWFFFRKHKGDPDLLRERLTVALKEGDLTAAVAVLEKDRSIEARVVHEALRWAHAGSDALSDAVESELGRWKKELEAGTNFLGTVGNNAPFVGLFGTVLGVIIAFEALGKTGSNSSAMGDVMAGIAEALVATGVGLFVALPAVVAYNVIQKRIGEIESDALALTKLVSAFARARGAQFQPLPEPAKAGDGQVAREKQQLPRVVV
jgi:biopolymer transport protein ExbB/biopolymer transport protein TolQ